MNMEEIPPGQKVAISRKKNVSELSIAVSEVEENCDFSIFFDKLDSVRMNNYTETYDFLVSIIGNAPYGIIAIDLQGNVVMCNEPALAHLGINQKVSDLVDKNLLSFIGDIPEFYGAVEECLAGGRQAFDLASVSFHEKFLAIKGRPIFNGIIFTTEDVTRSKTMELVSINSMLEGQEAERRRIAKEIHDGIGPLMSTIKLNLDALRSEMGGADSRILKKIETMLELVDTASSDIRSISHDLMPSALIDFGLVAALENLCLKASESGVVAVNFFHSGMKERLDQQMALSLYRIAQELLNNALKYGQATVINIQLIRHQASVVLMVEDDGIGFDLRNIGKLTENGIGLRNVKTRVKSLGGSFNLESQPGKGVLATVEIPLINA